MKYLKKLIAFVCPPSYDGIIKGFTKTITKLDELEEANYDAEARNVETIAALNKENRRLAAEAATARKTSDKLKQLLEG